VLAAAALVRAEQSACEAASVTGAELDGAGGLDPSAGALSGSDAADVLLDESPEQPVRRAAASRVATSARVAVRRGGSTGTA
jgi:hypothetical protein